MLSTLPPMLVAPLLQKDDLNQWLKDNPVVLGGILIAVGSLLVFFGLRGWKSGSTRGKYGEEISGGLGKTVSGMRLLLGAGFVAFGLFQLVKGLT